MKDCLYIYTYMYIYIYKYVQIAIRLEAIATRVEAITYYSSKKLLDCQDVQAVFVTFGLRVSRLWNWSPAWS